MDLRHTIQTINILNIDEGLSSISATELVSDSNKNDNMDVGYHKLKYLDSEDIELCSSLIYDELTSNNFENNEYGKLKRLRI